MSNLLRDIFGIKNRTSKKKFTSIYHKLCKEHHPDTGDGNVKLLNDIKDVYSDNISRMYDVRIELNIDINNLNDKPYKIHDDIYVVLDYKLLKKGYFEFIYNNKRYYVVITIKGIDSKTIKGKVLTYNTSRYAYPDEFHKPIDDNVYEIIYKRKIMDGVILNERMVVKR